MTLVKENIAHVCSICHEEIDYFAYGACNHPTCTKCILKLRKFGSANEPDFSKCPTCRRNLNKIVILESFIPFDDVNTSVMRYDAQYDFMFESQKIGDYYHNMLKSFCPICGDEKRSLSALNRHTTAEHQLSYCDLCIRYSRLLPCEFVPMKPADLIEHRKWDKVRRKGHPLCDFCEERFYEMEDLISHIRDHHFLCDLCMTTGKFVVFREQQELLEHYNQSHYLCQECRAQQRISCYSTADRLGLHRFQEHPNEVANDPNSWLPISIQMVPSQEGSRRRDPPGVFSVGGVLDTSDNRYVAEHLDSGVRFRRPNPAEWTGDDFPSLAPAAPQPSDAGGGGSGSILAAFRIASRGSSSAQASTGDNSLQRGSESAAGSVRPPTASLATTLAVRTARGKQNRLTEDDFPGLPGSSEAKNAAPPTWHTGSRAKQNVPQNKPSLPREVPPSPGDFPELASTPRVTSNCQGAPTTSIAQALARGRNQTADNRPAKSQPPAAGEFPALLTRSSEGGRGGVAMAAGRRLSSGDVTRSLPPGSNSSKSSDSAAKKDGQIGSAEAGRNKQARGMGRSQQGSNRRRAFEDEPSGPNPDYAILPEDRGAVFERPQYTHIRTVDHLPSYGINRDDDAVVNGTDRQGAGRPVHDLDRVEEFPSLSTNGISDTALPRRRKKQAPDDGRQIQTDQRRGGGGTQSSVSKDPVKKKSAKSHTLSTAAAVTLPADTECILFAETVYTPPPEVAARNKQLIENVENILFDVAGKTSFARFADLSRRYRHKQLTATAYMEGLLGLVDGDRSMGSTANSESPPAPLWIAPMLALLPDVGLQRALYRVLQGQGAPRLPQPDGSHRRTLVREPIIPPPAWAKQVLSLLKCCPQCGQVCLRIDMDTHSRDAHPSTGN